MHQHRVTHAQTVRYAAGALQQACEVIQPPGGLDSSSTTPATASASTSTGIRMTSKAFLDPRQRSSHDVDVVDIHEHQRHHGASPHERDVLEALARHGVRVGVQFGTSVGDAQR